MAFRLNPPAWDFRRPVATSTPLAPSRSASATSSSSAALGATSKVCVTEQSQDSQKSARQVFRQRPKKCRAPHPSGSGTPPLGTPPDFREGGAEGCHPSARPFGVSPRAVLPFRRRGDATRTLSREGVMPRVRPSGPAMATGWRPPSEPFEAGGGSQRVARNWASPSCFQHRRGFRRWAGAGPAYGHLVGGRRHRGIEGCAAEAGYKSARCLLGAGSDPGRCLPWTPGVRPPLLIKWSSSRGNCRTPPRLHGGFPQGLGTDPNQVRASK